MQSTPPATVIRLRQDRFNRRAAELGLETTTACAERIGIDASTLSRLRNGDTAPGERFIAGCLASKFANSFEDLFEVVEQAS